jgi:pilus assembly protein CpaE
MQRLDSSYWRALIGEVNGGPEILAAPETLGAKELPGAQQIRQALQFMRTQYEFMLLDLGRGLNRVTIAALEEIDEMFLISTLEVPALRQAKRVIAALASRGYSANRLHLVINRMPKKPDVTPSELESMLGTPVYAHIPNDYQALYEAHVAGRLVPPDGPVGRAIAALTCRMAGLEKPASRKRGFALFGRGA